MEAKFNTSFIPKQSLQTAAKGPSVHEYVQRRSTRGPGFYITFLIFFIACLTSIGLFVYTKYINTTIESKVASLEKARDDFEPKLILEFGRTDTRMTQSTLLLENHIAASELFALLEATTLRNIRYDSFNYNVVKDEGGPKISVTLSGQAPDFTSIAQQADQYVKNEFVRSPVISDLNVNKTDQAIFKATMEFDPRLTLFSRAISAKGTVAPKPVAVPVTPTATTSSSTAATSAGTATTTTP